MQATEEIWINGEFVPWGQARTHVLAHTLHYGAGAFEGVRAYRTAEGTAIFRLDAHLDRLFYSAASIRMPMRFGRDALRAASVELVRRNRLEEGYLRPIAFFGYGVMCVSPEQAPVDVVIACWPWGAYLPHEMVDLKISRYPRIPPDATVADAKLTGNYLNGILAVNEIRGTKYHEVLLLDVGGHVAEGSGENVFFVMGGQLHTPRLGAILPGITRATVLRIARDEGIGVVERDIRPEEAFGADEAFFTGTAAEVTPIRSIDDRVIGGGEVGPVTRRLRKLYLDVVHGAEPRYREFLTRVE
jgi:branched-chain amino acid aminotransferase